MAATTATSGGAKRKRGGRRWPWVVGGLVIIGILAALGFNALAANNSAPVGSVPEGWQVIAVEQGAIASTVGATGNLEAAAEVALRFELTGTIAEIMVAPGEEVAAGAPLAAIDDTDYQLQLREAQVSLRSAEADYEALLAGATPEDLAEAEARLDQARSQYQQTVSSVSQADIAAARGELERARARLAELQSGPASDELARANEQVRQAQLNLEQARTDLSAAKERARLDLEGRANSLRNVQDEYSRIYWENQNLAAQLARFGQDLPQENRDREAAALRNVQDGEAALEQARIAYEQAQQNEITGLQGREASLVSAQAEYDRLIGGAKAADLASARAEVQRAQASLDDLIGAARSSNLAASESNIDIAAIQLEKLNADPDSGQLAAREAAIARAEISIQQAQRRLDLTTLRAPFAATIAAIDAEIGASAANATFTLVDLSELHIDIPVDELDIARIAIGQLVRINLDALPETELSGRVTAIAPTATRNQQGTTTYDVTVTLDERDSATRVGMTAVVDIITAEKSGVILIPRRAVRSENGRSYVLINTPSATPTPAQPGVAVIPGERREVTLGLSNSEFVEVLSGLTVGEEILVEDVVSVFNPIDDN